ncbi:MAG TPA: UPF0182 family protein [Syntrophales bacterium]|nr:UPF0182 family protein [Syntrophales bacterium]HOM06803.1 UPF0182 family protein [Syntrophales bacterium]HON99502.1 UPF0182 family protein [Syntrophales bacterium]HPC00763.1 UPF0182 family protein [Syntrophales bacterium]HPQ06039.1 UPF0182 family protein [Syntrophales bacterium]
MPPIPHIRLPDRIPRGLIVLVVLLLALGASWQAVGLVTDWLWYQETGYEQVFTVTLTAKALAAALFGLPYFLFLFLNLILADRLAPRFRLTGVGGTIELIPRQGPLRAVIAAFSLALGVMAAAAGAKEWEGLLLFVNGLPFGKTDPLFGKDISFYVFSLPLLQRLFSWFLGLNLLTLASVAALYAVRGALVARPNLFTVAPPARRHLLILLSLLFFWGVFGSWLSLNELLFTKRGVVFGPGYTDVTTQVWVIKVLMGLNFLAGAALVAYAFTGKSVLPLAAVGVLAAFYVLGRGVYPYAVQRFQVVPNEIVRERPYLEWNIKYTRLAYQLDNIEERDFPAEENLTREDLRKNDLTIKNIRLWNDAPLLKTYGQLQEIRTYYKFLDVDNDRYEIDGEYRQVMISPRELHYPSLPSRTFVNERLTYTHGYGVVVGPVNRVTAEGLPEFFIRDIPPVSTRGLKVTRPEIYYGETSNDYVFVRTKAPEFDYPVGDKNVYSRYEGKGGVPLSFFRKILFAARFGSLTILLANEITDESRIMYYRTVRERVAKIAPFARLEKDPYLVITPEGRLVWFVDAYTVTDRFPYSEPVKGVGNYIRNSLKAIVDAYDGTVKIYVSDPGDPIIKTYQRIFPGVFLPLDKMPPELQRHIRYPGGMLGIQAHMYRAYHMRDPQVFYNKEDLWAIPGKPGRGGEEEMDPYYTVMKLPGEKREEFLMLVPFTPSRKDNMAAWMAARCDMPHYGQIIAYQFPKQKLIYGPRQIDARIDQDAEISKQLSLWNQRGSQALRGNLLAIPIERSILYVQPLYLAAEKGQLPELKRVIVAFGNTIAMEETLELCLQRIFGGELIRDGAARAEAPPTPREKGERELALEALKHYRKALEHLKQGDWASYGEEMRKLGEALRAVEAKR